MTGKRLTFQEFVERSRKNHGDKYTYHEETYNGTKKHTIITCPIHGDFPQTPKNHMEGQGCPQCGKEYAINVRKCQWEDFIKESNKRFLNKYEFPNIENEYENSHSKITIRCKECGNVFQKIACDHITSADGGCQQCRRLIRTKFYTYESIKKYQTVNAIKPFNGKITKNDMVTLICPIHGEYSIRLKNFLYGKGTCRKCTCGKAKRTKDSFKAEFEIKYGGLVEADYTTFVSMSEPMVFHCKVCGNAFKRAPQAMISAHYKHGPCPICSQNERSKIRTKTTEDFKRQVEAKYGKHVFDMSKTIYTKSRNLVTLKCNECGKYFTIEANSLLQGHGCPHHNRNNSKAEQEIADYIKQLGFNVTQNERAVLPSHKELDIYIPSHKIAIEYDGLFWHNENIKGKDYHLNKTIECQENGIKLFHVFEDEWIERHQVWESLLATSLGKKYKQQYSKPSIIMEIDNLTAQTFIEKNSLFNYGNYDINTGIFNDDKMLIFALSLNKDSSVFIYAALSIGTSSSLLALAIKYIQEHYQLKSPLNTFVDLRWDNGEQIKSLGFKKKEIIPPQFHYGIWSTRKTQAQFSLLSEEEKNKKWFKIYDCGYEKYALEN